jgi:NAD(P)-dependent dehydrogenase (short-subunit alcohol dehydrogenase family)
MPDPQTVLITGAAGAIGSATSAAFLRRGLAVLGVDRQVAGPPAGSDRYVHVVADLTDPQGLGAVGDALAGMPPLAHLVGIAGGALPEEPATQHDLEAVRPELFRASLEANLTSQFLAMRLALPHLRARTGGSRSITLTSSFNALSAQGMPAYSAAKAGLIGLMHGSVRPLGTLGIRINVVAPGTVRTPRTEKLWAADPGHFERLEAGTALGHLAAPEDVAAVFTAVSLDFLHVTGQVLTVDGGQSVIHR